MPMTQRSATGPLAAGDQAIESPCIRICVIDPASGLCEGCGRTLAEIASWGSLSCEARAEIMRGLAERLARKADWRPEPTARG